MNIKCNHKFDEFILENEFGKARCVGVSCVKCRMKLTEDLLSNNIGKILEKINSLIIEIKNNKNEADNELDQLISVSNDNAKLEILKKIIEIIRNILNN